MRLKIPGFWSCLYAFLLLFLIFGRNATTLHVEATVGCEILCCACWLFSTAPFHLCRGTSHRLALDLRTGVNHVKPRNRQVEMLIPDADKWENQKPWCGGSQQP
ncbi:hypothetical protein J3E69DRAFT_330280 [Trichoderma sp. SZMC 28015]